MAEIWTVGAATLSAIIAASAALYGTKSGQHAVADLERVKQGRQVMVEALNAAMGASDRVVGDFRGLRDAVDDARNAQFTAPGRAPRETERIVSARQTCRLALTTCEGTASKLSLVGFSAAHDAMVELIDSAAILLAADPTAWQDGTRIDTIVALHSKVVELLRDAWRTVLG